MKLQIAVALSTITLTGCLGMTAPVYLQHSTTTDMVVCGPYPRDDPIAGTSTALREAQCIQDYKRQGYERVPAP